MLFLRSKNLTKEAQFGLPMSALYTIAKNCVSFVLLNDIPQFCLNSWIKCYWQLMEPLATSKFGQQSKLKHDWKWSLMTKLSVHNPKLDF